MRNVRGFATTDATIAVVKPPFTVRERTEELERASLSTWATLSAETKGRDRHEAPDSVRTAFQRDRDRILHSRAFRRLRDKTHAFIATGRDPEDQRYRTRLTHALEVSQIARTIARGLRLNEDLVEAIALGHDLGQPAFGDAGEPALEVFTNPPFRHHEQSVRVVEQLERAGNGLNLTWEVRDGILHHPWSMAPGATPESHVVQLANRVAVLTHDLNDALRTGLLHPEQLPPVVVKELGRTHGQRVATFVGDIVGASEDRPEIRFSTAVDAAQQELAQLLSDHVAGRPEARSERDRAMHCLRSLVVYHLEDPSALPRGITGDEPQIEQVLDYVSGLGDAAALRIFAERFLPRANPTG